MNSSLRCETDEWRESRAGKDGQHKVTANSWPAVHRAGDVRVVEVNHGSQKPTPSFSCVVLVLCVCCPSRFAGVLVTRHASHVEHLMCSLLPKDALSTVNKGADSSAASSSPSASSGSHIRAGRRAIQECPVPTAAPDTLQWLEKTHFQVTLTSALFMHIWEEWAAKMHEHPALVQQTDHNTWRNGSFLSGTLAKLTATVCNSLPGMVGS